MRNVFSVMIALMMLSMTACSNAPKEYEVKNPDTQTVQSQALTQTTEPAEEIEEQIEEVAEPATEVNYIGNANSYKFHEPYCSSVDQMNESNKVLISTRNEAIESGYEPCQRCNP